MSTPQVALQVVAMAEILSLAGIELVRLSELYQFIPSNWSCIQLCTFTCSYIIRSVIVCTTNKIQIIITRWVRWAGNIAYMGEIRNAYAMLVGKTTGKIPPGNPTI
jgi:hypothetical protein